MMASVLLITIVLRMIMKKKEKKVLGKSLKWQVENIIIYIL